MKLDHLKALTNRAAVVKVSTALNPMLWLAAVVTPASLLAAVFSSTPSIQLLALGLAASPVILAGVAYFIFLFRDPNRLQSEEFQLRQQELILLRKGDEAPILIDEAESLTRGEAVERGKKGTDK